MKKLEDEPYTQAEAERAAGMGNYVAPKKAKVTTQDLPETMDTKDDTTLTNTWIEFEAVNCKDTRIYSVCDIVCTYAMKKFIHWNGSIKRRTF